MNVKTGYCFGLMILIMMWVTVSSSTGSAATAESYRIDPDHTSVVFRVKHLDVAYVYGRFNNPQGEFIFDAANPEKSRISMHVMASEVDTAVSKRDIHLRNADFFDATQHPRISFVSNGVRKLDAQRYEISGDLTLLGKTMPIKVEALLTGQGADPWGGYRTGFKSEFSIRRSEFGMDFLLNGVGDEVQLTVSVEGIRQ